MAIENCPLFKPKLKICISNEAFSANALKTRLQDVSRLALRVRSHHPIRVPSFMTPVIGLSSRFCFP